MARVEPFKAWRPRRDVCADVASPPYDVLSSTEAREAAADNPLSFLRVVKPEIGGTTSKPVSLPAPVSTSTRPA